VPGHTLAPENHRGPRDAEFRGDGVVRAAGRCRQHDASAQHDFWVSWERVPKRCNSTSCSSRRPMLRQVAHGMPQSLSHHCIISSYLRCNTLGASGCPGSWSGRARSSICTPRDRQRTSSRSSSGGANPRRKVFSVITRRLEKLQDVGDVGSPQTGPFHIEHDSLDARSWRSHDDIYARESRSDRDGATMSSPH